MAGAGEGVSMEGDVAGALPVVLPEIGRRGQGPPGRGTIWVCLEERTGSGVGVPM